MSMVIRTSITGREKVEFENVGIIHRNFSGVVKEYNKSGQRSFSIILMNDEADELINRGFNVRQRPARENPDDVFCFLPCFVNYEHMPPAIFRISGDRMIRLNENTVGLLDNCDILNVDVVVNARHWDIQGKIGIKCYVDAMYVTVEEDRFANKYADYIISGE